jgi:hypothetical protein
LLPISARLAFIPILYSLLKNISSSIHAITEKPTLPYNVKEGIVLSKIKHL